MSSTFECCKQGSFHKGTPKGTETTVAGRKAYVTGPEDAKAAVLLIADVFGWALNNTRVLADGYAEGIGARVYVPDFFDGEALPTEIMDDPEKRAKFDLMAFLGKHHPRNAAYPLVEPVAKEIKSKHGKLGAIGFCWGAPSTLWLGGPGKIADAVAFAHPSVTETSDFEALEKPGLFLCAEIDQQLTDEKRNAAIEVTKRLAKERNLFTKWVYYPRVSHGFAVRGDEEEPFSARAMRDAASEAVTFFRAELL